MKQGVFDVVFCQEQEFNFHAIFHAIFFRNNGKTMVKYYHQKHGEGKEKSRKALKIRDFRPFRDYDGNKIITGDEGFEPPSAVLETVALPLN